MADFVTLSCPSCGGKLQISNDIDRFACGYCGQEHIVKRAGGLVSLAPVLEAISGVQQGVDRTASELAISRLEREIAGLEERKLQLYTSYPPAGDSGLPVIFLIFGGISACAGTLLGFADNGTKCAFIFGIILLGIGLYGLFTQSQAKSSREKIMEEAIPPIDKALNEKKRDLAKHKNIVSMQ